MPWGGSGAGGFPALSHIYQKVCKNRQMELRTFCHFLGINTGSRRVEVIALQHVLTLLPTLLDSQLCSPH